MRFVPRALLFLALVAVACAVGGCSSFWHDMQPHRLQRMNRGPGMPTGPEAYSVCEVRSTMV